MILNESGIYPYSTTDLSDRNCLVIAPHPDDESIGCGGSIVRHAARGSAVTVLFLTSGDQGDFNNAFGDDYSEKRRASASEALSLLGIKDHQFLGFRDRELYKERVLVYKEIEEAVKKMRPGLIYAPSPYEPHPDHRTAAWAAWRAHEETGIDTAFYEVLAPLFPNILVDISGEFSTKESAIQSYGTELLYNDYREKARGLNRFRTATLGPEVKYAEAFALSSEEYQGGLSCLLLKDLIERRSTGLK